MKELTRTMRWSRAAAWVVCVTASSSAAACASAGPPRRAAEVPIDQFPTEKGPANPGDPANPAEPAPAEPGSPAGATGAQAAPTPLPTSDAPASATSGDTGGAAHARPPAGQRLTAGDCSRLTDRYVALVGASQGLKPAAVTKAMPQLRTQAQNEPFYASVQTTCVDRNSRKQYQCAIKATTTDAWKACLQ